MPASTTLLLLLLAPSVVVPCICSHVTSTVALPDFSFDTLPVFFHARNSSTGSWSPDALARLSRFPLVTSSTTGIRFPNGSYQSSEVAGPETCRAVSKASQGRSMTFGYVHSLFDLPNQFNLHAEMVAHPEWRLKYPNGSDIIIQGYWVFDFTNLDMRARWIQECTDLVKAGCTGCFIDEANVQVYFANRSAAGDAYSRAHLETLVQLNQQLGQLGTFSINNHLGDQGDHVVAMMIEDFAGSEKCINMLRTITQYGFIVEAHAGDEPANYSCANGGTNSLAAFLIGMGNYSYYHCQGPPYKWEAHSDWPNVPADEALDWLPEYEYKLGRPLGDATTRPSSTGENASVWSRSFDSGTRVEFDGGNGNGTIWWSNGPVQVGGPTSSDPTVVAKGCKWETDKPVPSSSSSSSSSSLHSFSPGKL